jgi:hypothetical protein
MKLKNLFLNKLFHGITLIIILESMSLPAKTLNNDLTGNSIKDSFKYLKRNDKTYLEKTLNLFYSNNNKIRFNIKIIKPYPDNKFLKQVTYGTVLINYHPDYNKVFIKPSQLKINGNIIYIEKNIKKIVYPFVSKGMEYETITSLLIYLFKLYDFESYNLSTPIITGSNNLASNPYFYTMIFLLILSKYINNLISKLRIQNKKYPTKFFKKKNGLYTGKW